VRIMPDYTTNAVMRHNYAQSDKLTACALNKVVDGVDRQSFGALKYVGGDGIVAGAVIDALGNVGPTTAIADGWAGITTGNTAIIGLANGVTNTIWCCRVDPPTLGPYAYDCAYATTFNSGALQFLARVLQPPHSFLVGYLPVSGGGVIGVPVNDTLERPLIMEAAAKTWRGSHAVVGLAEGDPALWCDVDHSADIEFDSLGLLQFYNPKPAADGGFSVYGLENCQKGTCGFWVKNEGAAGPHYGDTSVTIYVARTGMPTKHTIPVQA